MKVPETKPLRPLPSLSPSDASELMQSLTLCMPPTTICFEGLRPQTSTIERAARVGSTACGAARGAMTIAKLRKSAATYFTCATQHVCESGRSKCCV